MGRHKFHSELTCDEVWYRLNVLLQSFAVCGAKRYEVRGALTEWGCRLWLRNPDGYGGTPFPLRLWTEEDGSGCEIAWSFLPAGRELWSLPAAGAGFWLEVFLAEVVGGTPLLRALLVGFFVGCITAAVMFPLFFLFPRLFSRKRENELLQWVQTYLLLRQLDGVLLPDLETQKEEWTGLPQKAEPVKKRRFAFHSPLPPEELPAAIEGWTAQQSLRQEGWEVRWSARRQGNRITILRTEIETGRKEGVQSGRGSVAYVSGRYKTWQSADPFRGTVEPDGRGGSILRGAFVPSGLFLAIEAAVLLAVCIALYWCLPVSLALPLSAAAAVLCVIQIRKAPLKDLGSCAILKFLQTYLEEI